VFADQRKQVAAERIHVSTLDDGEQAVVGRPHIDRSRRKVDADVWRKRKHRLIGSLTGSTAREMRAAT
jgi:hypothetical protein